MKFQKISCVAIAIAVLASGMVFIQCSDQAAGNDRQSLRAQFAKAERETPELKAKRAEFYQRGIERINKKVGEGKMDQARAAFALKRMANVHAFMDNNPEWTKYLFADKKNGKKGEGKKIEGKKKDGKKFEGKKRDGEKKDRAKIDRPKKDSAELKANWEKNYQLRIDRINQKAAEGKIEKARADFLLKWMANDKAFKDANPEWAEYGSKGRGFQGFGGKGEGKGRGEGKGKGERAKKAK